MHYALQALRDFKTYAAGKLMSLSSVGAVGDSTVTQPRELRLHVFDITTQLKFLVDSGSVVSILPASKFRKNRNPDILTLYAANSSEITTCGTETIDVNLNLRRQFPWSFIIADVPTPIIGADFLANYNPLIDIANRQLIDSTTQLAVKGETGPIEHYNISTVSSLIPSRYAELLKQYINITKPLSRPCMSKKGYSHRIITYGPPPTARPRKLAGEKATAAKK
ncbi:uncharacterized protein LOC123273931 [Cotesia glomerata]|uniref:uncharacterized protein LOC123273931 n=1 Tax=Cotesia glomerata TaxID=32391 RepID=UPI001D020107|nr:uncharacterized protein LOC123273931 [Cotesia glomerata]